MSTPYYVYVLRSLINPGKLYVGFTERLDERLAEHNAGSQIYSKRYAPWERVAHLAFATRPVAVAFEKYLKTASGKAFLQKHIV